MKLQIFVNKCPISLFHFHLEIRYEERAFDHFHLLLTHDIFLREILQIESIVLLYSEGG